MSRIIFLLLFAAIIPLESNAEAGDDCLYNQDAFKEMYSPIKAKYKNTKYLKGDQSIEINLNDSKIIVRYFGCEHYGTEIKYFENQIKVYSDKEIFEKTIDLIKRFGQDRINLSVLRGLLNSGKYQKFENRTFTVNYPEMDELSITVDKQAGKPLIEIGFYN
jgi:hypothetical protein